MIQELLGGGKAPTTSLVKDINIISSIPFPPSSFSSPTTTCPSNSPISTTPVASTTTLANTSNSSSVANNTNNNNNNNNTETSGQKLRCPRCDSTNTKFCYYNNYNLTQPRHFCKTCRRYWTRGGTLRNVPIGGGCRKNKTTSSVTPSSSPSSTSVASGFSKSSFNALVRAPTNGPLSTELFFPGNPALLGNGFLDPQSELQIPTLWPSLAQPQSSHILALFRGASQSPNPNPNPNPKPSPLSSTSTPTLGFDPFGNGAPALLGSFQRLNGFGPGVPDHHMGHQNGGNGSNILQLYQRLKSSVDYGYCGHENPGPLILGNVMGSSSSTATTSSSPSPSLPTSSSSPSVYMASTTLREAPVGGAGDNLGGYGGIMMSSAIPSWSELSTVPINGAFP